MFTVLQPAEEERGLIQVFSTSGLLKETGGHQMSTAH